MLESLQEKLSLPDPIYSFDEVAWLLEHIGHPKPEIRDELVFETLACGLTEGFFSLQQFRFLVEESLSKNLLFYQMEQQGVASLTRSFTALLLANIVEVDDTATSPYYRLLSKEERQILFEYAFTYLQKERDSDGYSLDFGWVHAFAHGADFLVAVVTHSDFPKAAWPTIFQTLSSIFKRVSIRFSADEEWRLARVIYQAVTEGKLSQNQLVAWLEGIDFPLETVEDFIHFSNFRSFLMEIYLKLDQEKLLSKDLKAVIQSFSYS
ncbi:DUF2785 domain-containing protein [Streptococcus oricebi]|uniref:DUF2785 domain-containing protein n=1 Tax=Streptococcus oricebi TaxID=1547447 RepID=A0ABS5B136_9STRE|nr:DUF2785 domain-containing protein [Streptococcus oricebi]MBP2622538.1 hypothetical protein [Streptococcus oricebi]